ncbi:polysaccharide lyase family 4 protein [Aplosporella prunicola CBS 121167]|uniref:rhamnogalacturonan endolyase n=1 Tax=Aplosporella prunicola CBS 121167 TaxID=1176127 RepID=A0A6A6BFZ6_9PEZI|nr:polysaccharide lyase family 4 protein [Aplosporella prunicola CBS 121167]KAF2141847.1 polysaccharide lyase family 4 protein [Aplosporella prunicola CBS 121167]
MAFFWVGLFLTLVRLCAARGPFLKSLNNTYHVIGNDLWNITQGPTYGKKLYYKGQDLIGDAVGHYTGYNGESNLVFTSAEIFAKGDDYIDVRFNATEGELHWVIFDDLPGAYQYFVNRALPVLGVFRTLVRLDNQTFTHGRTNIKDDAFPALAEIRAGTNVQDETWEKADGTFITKYDWSDFIRSIDYYGVYGEGFGSWYIRPGTDYFNGDHLKQELIVHRESSTGDTVQLNVVHGTHFMASSADAFPNGKIFGPWLWYLNDGSKEDAAARQEKEFASWPYTWLQDAAYQSRVESISGKIVLSDGRPAAGAAVFLGDNNPNETSLDQGRYYNYATYADDTGAFTFEHVRTGTYGLQAWSNGGLLSNVTSTFLQNDVVVSTSDSTSLDTLTWTIPENRKQIFQVGDFDRKALGFKNGGSAYQHGLAASSPANLTFTVGTSKTEEWYFAQSANGTWDIVFEVDEVPASGTALLSVSLAGYSKGVSSNIYVNGLQNQIGNLTNNRIPSDPALYRSGTTAGEWHLYEFEFDGPELLKQGENTLSFVVDQTTLWRGFLWDSVILEWVD